MVALTAIKSSNALLSKSTAQFTAVFLGGTAGIGKETMRALICTGVRCNIYLIGRASARQSSKAFIHDMQSINKNAKVTWVEAEASLLTEVNKACDTIISQESRVDLVLMTCGYAPFSSRVETSEGIEVTQSLQYYARILLTLKLLPLLAKAKTPKVISVLAGGKEPSSIALDDLDLQRPENFGGFKSQAHYNAMNTVILEMLADQWPGVTFVHSFPGWVKTGNNKRGLGKGTWMSSVVFPLLDPLVNLMSISPRESGQRHLFTSMSEAVGGRGVAWSGKRFLNTKGDSKGGLFLIDHNCDVAKNQDALERLRKDAQRAVWQHTEKKLGLYL